jgi:hypothetical protein
MGDGLRIRLADADSIPGCALELPFYARLGFVEIPRETSRPQSVAIVLDETDRELDPETRVVMGYRSGTPLIQERQLSPRE